MVHIHPLSIVVRDDAGVLGVAADQARNGYELAGSLALPDSAAVQSPKPGVLIVPGPGPSPLTRSTGEGEDRWPLIWARELAEAGFVALCFDQRGGGQSTGRYSDADRNSLYQDTVAVLETLAVQPEVDREALVAIAWDEGCGFALQLAAEGRVHALVLMATPFYTAEERFTREIRQLAARRGLSERVVQLRLNQWRRQMDAVARQVAGGEKTTSVKVGEHETMLNLARFLQNTRFDPAAVLAHVHVPVLVLHGEDDRVIPPQESAELISALVARGAVHDGGAGAGAGGGATGIRAAVELYQRIVYREAGHFLYNDRRLIRDAITWLTGIFGIRRG